MRRWNGWGDDSVDHTLPDTGRAWFASQLGDPEGRARATFDDVVARVPTSRLSPHPLIDTAPATRVRRAVGQSFEDWVEVHAGTVHAFPDAVACPTSSDEVAEILRLGAEQGAVVVPWGGGTSVAGHLRVPGGDRPVLLCSMEQMTDLVDLDADGCLATLQAGAPGPLVERQLGAHGFTLGHYPQSWELSTLGGWVATRSSGQLSKGYGRIEDLFAGGRVETPAGPLTCLPHPASAAGPDLRQLVLGSEGRLGVITECLVKVRPRPEVETFRGAFLPSGEAGIACARALGQARIDLSMVRLSLPAETRGMMAISGRSGSRTARLLDAYLGVRGITGDRCLLLYGASGTAAHARASLAEAGSVIRAHGGVRVGKAAGDSWERSRFHSPYLRNHLWEAGIGVDTLETAVQWANVPGIVAAVEAALTTALHPFGEKVVAFTHLSHVYPHGSSCYTSYGFRLAADPEETLARWRACKTAASEAIVAHQGTISHQHGVGLDHKPWLEAEKGALGLDVLRDVFHRFDPDGVLDNGNLVDR